jgi:hypothetical protein
VTAPSEAALAFDRFLDDGSPVIADIARAAEDAVAAWLGTIIASQIALRAEPS